MEATKTPTIADITNARKCAEYNTDAATGLTWIGNAMWSDAVAMNWRRMCDGLPGHVVAGPRPEDGHSSEWLTSRGVVGIYEHS